LRDRWLGIVLVALTGVSYAVQGILSQYAYRGGADVPTLLALRFGVGTLVIWALLLAMPRALRPPLRYPRRDLLGFGLLGALFVTNALFYYLSLTQLPVGTAAVLVFVFPALVVLWSVLFFGERLTALKAGALLLALAGVVFTVDPAAALAVGMGFSWLGVLWALGSAFSNSWYVVLAGAVGRGKPSLAVALYSLPVTAVFFGGYLLVAGGSYGMETIAWASCLAIGALTGVSIYLYLIGLARIGASRAAIVATSEPATALLLGALLLSEAVTPVKLLGGACIAAAITLLSLPGERDPLAVPVKDDNPTD
jgi:drug/metabolite transporter (DMT)-like permease